jgi:hypothetical protein
MNMDRGDGITFTEEEVKHYRESGTVPATYLARRKFLLDFGLASADDPDFELKKALVRMIMSKDGSREFWRKVLVDGLKKKFSKKADAERPATK